MEETQDLSSWYAEWVQESEDSLVNLEHEFAAAAIAARVAGRCDEALRITAKLQALISFGIARISMTNHQRDVILKAVGHLDSSRYARQAGDVGSAEAALDASRRILLGLVGISADAPDGGHGTVPA